MAKITLDISDKNLTTVMTILNSIKNDLIDNISCDSKLVKPNKPIPSSKTKYLSRDAYKEKLNKR